MRAASALRKTKNEKYIPVIELHIKGQIKEKLEKYTQMMDQVKERLAALNK